MTKDELQQLQIIQQELQQRLDKLSTDMGVTIANNKASAAMTITEKSLLNNQQSVDNALKQNIDTDKINYSAPIGDLRKTLNGRMDG